MDDNAIIQLITSSYLSDEDKSYWTNLLPKMSMDQKQELSNILSIKAKVRHAIAEIDHALQTIEMAESSVDTEQADSLPTTTSSEDLSKQYENIVKSAPNKIDLEDMKRQEEQRLLDLRNQLKSLSLSSQNTLPPSSN